jgi:hypothetical protein
VSPLVASVYPAPHVHLYAGELTAVDCIAVHVELGPHTLVVALVVALVVTHGSE